MNLMKYTTICWVVLILGCQNAETGQVGSAYDATIGAPIPELTQKPQILIASSANASTVTGAKGTRIAVNPKDLQFADGTIPSGDIEVHLLELTTMSDLILNHVRTTSDGEILVTGGAFYINMTSGGKQLYLKEGKGYEVTFPRQSDEIMSLFSGERDSTGQMDWTMTNPPRTTMIDTIISPVVDSFGQVVYRDTIIQPLDSVRTINSFVWYNPELNIYFPVSLRRFGWTNIDLFLKDERKRVELEFAMENSEAEDVVMYMMFKNFASLLSKTFEPQGNKPLVIQNIPTNESLVILALARNRDKTYYFEKEITSSLNLKTVIQLEEMSKEDIEARIRSLDVRGGAE